MPFRHTKNKTKRLSVIGVSLPDLIKIKFFKGRIPLIVTWKITTRCNLRCGYCHIPHLESEELNTESVIGSFKELRKCGTKVFQLTGGEPLVREDILDLLAAARNCFLYVALSTNGKSLSQKFKALDYIDELKLSLDGPKDIHDKIRGSGSYDLTIEAAELAFKKKVYVTFLAVITNVNYKYVAEILRIARDYSAVVMFQPATYSLLEGTSENPFVPGIEDYRNCIMELINMRKRGWNIANSVSSLKCLYCRPHYPSTFCLEGVLTCRIQPNGDVVGCDRMPIRKEALNIRRDGAMNAFQNLPLRQCSECSCAERVELNNLANLGLNSIGNFLFNV